MQRLFFALWPPAPIAQRLRGRADRLGLSGRAVPAERLHVTLAFHGSCDAGRRAALMARAQSLRLPPPLELVFDRVGYFPGQGIVWFGLTHVPAGLTALASALSDDGADDRAFVPHITIARHASPIEPKRTPSIRWRAREFALVESGALGRPGGYRCLGRWPLRAAGEAGRGVK